MKVLLVAAVLLAPCALAAAQRFVPFAIPAEQNSRSLIAMAGEPIRTDSPRVVVRDGHFHAGDRRLRVWGVNLCFAGCFPSHEDAEGIAARMSAFGVNSVRFHHMDSRAFPGGIWDAREPTRLSEEALDRLDYFIDQLARRGIYANVNLHVSRTHSQHLGLPAATQYDKMVDLFTPALVEAQKRYARDLLTRVNAYRKVRYADDPAVAFVEITNEDSLFMWGWESKLRSLGDPYAAILRGRYNEWLGRRYGTTAKLAEAWSRGAVPLGENLLADLTRLAPAAAAPRRWELELHQGCQAAATPLAGQDRAVRIEVQRGDEVSWHIQFRQFGLRVTGGAYYTLTFRARSDRQREVTVGLGQHESPWGNLGLSQRLRLTPQWTPVRLGFLAKADSNNARLSLALSHETSAVELADVELRPGGREGLGKEEDPKAGSVALFGPGDTDARSADRLRFLAETEKAYFDSMRSFVRKDLGCGALVTGTIVFGPLGLWAQSDMDYIDGHAYWQHPRFPGRPWDPTDWTVEQRAMVDHPDEATLHRLAAQRLAGKPYTVSEYNHPAPNDYQAECVPMIASYAAAQDWDGVWLFAYNHSGRWDRQAYNGFFDIDANPAKWGFMPAGAAVFEDPGVQPLAARHVTRLCRSKDVLGELTALYQTPGGQGGSLAAITGASRRPAPQVEACSFRDAEPAWRPPGAGDAASLAWVGSDGNDRRGRFQVRGPGAIVLVGDLSADGLSPGFSALVVSAMDGQALDRSAKVLLTACGRCENTGMEFSADRRTVGRNWGGPPVQIEPVEGTLKLGFLAPGRWTCRALKPDGTAANEVPLTGQGGERAIRLSADRRTMWYLLTRDPR